MDLLVSIDPKPRKQLEIASYTYVDHQGGIPFGRRQSLSKETMPSFKQGAVRCAKI